MNARATKSGFSRRGAASGLMVAALALAPAAAALAQSEMEAGPEAEGTASPLPGQDARAAVSRAADLVTAGRTMEAVEALREAALTVWSAAPFDIHSLVVTTEAAKRYGDFDAADAATVARGDAIHLYVEPVGMAYEFADGAYSMRLTGDFLIEDPDGAILGGQKDFADVPFTFPVPATEVYMPVSLGPSSLPPGDYVINMTFHDPLGDASATRKIPFTVTPPAE
jgi:hypothetical protein